MPDDLDAARREIAQLKLELNRASAELEEFTYSVSHDLRASLRHVTAYVQIIKEDLGGNTDEGIATSLDTVSVAAKHMGLLIDGLMELSRVGHTGVNPARIDTSALLHELMGTHMPDMAGRQIRKGAADAIRKHVEALGGKFPPSVSGKVDEVARRGSSNTRGQERWRALRSVALWLTMVCACFTSRTTAWVLTRDSRKSCSRCFNACTVQPNLRGQVWDWR